MIRQCRSSDAFSILWLETRDATYPQRSPCILLLQVWFFAFELLSLVGDCPMLLYVDSYEG